MRKLSPLFVALLLPGVGPVDTRAPVDPGQPPWRALGRVQTELGTRCTGFLVGPRTVLTAAHCLYRLGPQRFVQPGSVHFLLGYSMGAYAAHARVLAYRTGPDWVPGQTGRSSAADWAVLTLDAALGTPDRLLPLATTLPAAGAQAMLGGYGKDRAEVIDADRDCLVLGLARDAAGRPLIVHACAGTNGTSGAPLLVRDGTGWAAAGIQVGAAQNAARGVAAPISPELRSALQ